MALDKLNLDSKQNAPDDVNFNNGENILSPEQQHVINNLTPDQLQEVVEKARVAESKSKFTETSEASLAEKSANVSNQVENSVVDPKILEVKNSLDSNSIGQVLTDGKFITDKGDPLLNLQEFMDKLNHRN